MSENTRISYPSTFRSVEEFDASQDALEAARMGIQASYACGCFLKLEKAFAQCPLVEQIQFRGDYEGWHIYEAFVRRPGGDLVCINDVFCAFYREDEEQSERETPKAYNIKPSHSDLELIREFAHFKPEHQQEKLRDAEDCGRDALSLFNRMAPDFFYKAIKSDVATLTPGRAVDLARQCGLDEIASLLERVDIEASSTTAPSKIKPSL